LRASAAVAVDPTMCPPNGTVLAGKIDTDLHVAIGKCHLRNILIKGSIVISGDASLTVDGEGNQVGGAITAENSPGSTIKLSGVEVKEVKLSDAGNLEIGEGSKLGPIEVARSGHITIVNSSAFGMKFVDSGNLTISNGASVGELEASGSGHVSIGGDAKVAAITASMCKGLVVDGGAHVAREVEVSFIAQSVKLGHAALGGSLTVLTSPDANIDIGAARVPEVLVSQAGNLAVGAGAELGSITSKSAGDVIMSGSVGRDLNMEGSGNLTVTAGASLRNIVVKESGLTHISQNAAVSSVKTSMSWGLVISDNVTVKNEVEALNNKGDILLQGSMLGGPVSIFSSSGDISLVHASVVAEGLFVERGGGSLRMVAAAFPNLQVKGLKGDLTFANMDANNLDLDGVQGRVVLEAVKSHGESIFSDIAGGIACISPASTPGATPSSTSGSV